MIGECHKGLDAEVETYYQRLEEMQDFLGTMHSLLNMVLAVKKTGIVKVTRTLAKVMG